MLLPELAYVVDLDEVDTAERCDHLFQHHGRCYWCGAVEEVSWTA